MSYHPRRSRYMAWTALATLTLSWSGSSLTSASRIPCNSVRLTRNGIGALGVSMTYLMSRSIAHASSSGIAHSDGHGQVGGKVSLPHLDYYLDAKNSQKIDEDLMSAKGGFRLEQLMELAGLSVASAAQDMLCPTGSNKDTSQCSSGKKILIICGPGNNGGDGLVAARHLKHFGHSPTILYPRRGKNPFFTQLCLQCSNIGIPIHDSLSSLGVDECEDDEQNEDDDREEGDESEDLRLIFNEYDLIVDALFGFSYKGPAREPFDNVLKALAEISKRHKAGFEDSPPVLSVDVPSGWSVEDGDIFGTGFVPSAVISLTAPKQCMRGYTGQHFLGGRFLPEKLQQKYHLSLPPYDINSPTQLYKYPTEEAKKEKIPVVDNEWVMLLTPEGFPYHYNTLSGESRWAAFQPPTAFPSTTVNSKEDDDKEISLYISTAADMKEAKVLARHLVQHRLAACVNLIPGVVSVYEWEGQLEEGSEAMLVIKTRRSLVPEVTEAIKDLHSYDVPEGISVDIATTDPRNGQRLGNSDYIDWVLQQSRSK